MTTHDDDPTTRKISPRRLEGGTERSLSFLTERGTFNVALPSEGSLVIGRTAQADIRLEDDSVSRRHARVDVGDVITVEDLGSSNGTRLHDRVLGSGERSVLRAGEVFFVGEVLCLVQGASQGPPRRVWPVGHVFKKIEEHCARHKDESGQLALLRVRATGVPREEFDSQLLNSLSPADMVAPLKEGEALVLLFERDATEAEGLAALLRARLGGPGRTVAIGAAIYPRHGADAAALVAHTASALDGAARAEGGPEVVIQSPAVQRLHVLLERVAQGTINVLLLGETGAGKEVFASRLHALSPRASKPYVKFNCAALSDSLVEAELFGHEKGAFTGAAATRAGLIEAAHGGTVFLDEVGELSLAVQAKLLRVLEDRRVRRVGATQERPVDVRFVAATNRDLEAECAAGRFRQDLYFRLNGVALKIPPLRERPEEIEPLARKFLVRGAAQAGLAQTPTLTPAALALLQRHTWPGNIRELRNVLERAVLLCDGASITPADLAIEPTAAAPPSVPSIPPGATSQPPPAPVVGRVSAPSERPDLSPLDLAERDRIVEALERCLWNQSEAARQLGISRKVLMNRMDRYGLPRPHKNRDEG